MANKHKVLLKFFVNLNSHSVFKFKGKIKFIAVTYPDDRIKLFSMRSKTDLPKVEKPVGA
jgi:hypothetical protein